MNNFKILLEFSLLKRIKNKTFIFVNSIIFVIVLGLMYSDMYIERIVPEMFEKPIVYTDNIELGKFLKEYLAESFIVEIDEYYDEMICDDSIYFVSSSEVFDIISFSGKNNLELSIIQNALLAYSQQINYISLLEQGILFSKEIVVHVMEESQDNKETWGFMIVTAIYFFAMSFASIVANDVVYEKATRMMEMILTSTSAKIHLLSKLCSGWLMLIIQFGLLLVEIVFISSTRLIYDNGKGIIQMLYKLGFISQPFDFNMRFVLDFIRENHRYIGLVGIAMIIMFLGILLIQLVLVVLSSYISSIEEAGSIQSPFYMLFMGVYYLTIFMNNSISMNEGMGKTLSMIPFFSMLFMPCRILCYNVTYMEVIISTLISLVTFLVVLCFGSIFYQRGVLDYSSANNFIKLGKGKKDESCNSKNERGKCNS